MPVVWSDPVFPADGVTRFAPPLWPAMRHRSPRDRSVSVQLEQNPMFQFKDLFQWDRFITPSIIKSFYWLVIVLIVLSGLSGVLSALAAMAISPFGGFLLLLASLAAIVVGIIFSRIGAELILIVFRINEHLGAIRDQGRERERQY
jgi:hypothetical protein